MVEKNKHKFAAKSGLCTDDMEEIDGYERKLSLNFSRTLGQSRNWIGCGYIENMPGANGDHTNVRFPFYSLVYVIHGEGTYIDEHGKAYPLSAGSVFQRRPKIVHTTLVKPDSGWKEYYLDCNEELYDHLSSMSLIDPAVAVYKNEISNTIISRLDALMAQLQKGSEDEVSDAYISHLSILRTLLSWKEEAVSRKDIVQESLADFESGYARRFDLKTYCREKGWGYEKFRKDFKNQLGVSPRDYLIRKRMDEACRLLRATDMKIIQIASQLGYASQYEFSNQFNRYFSVAPKHYREGV